MKYLIIALVTALMTFSAMSSASDLSATCITDAPIYDTLVFTADTNAPMTVTSFETNQDLADMVLAKVTENRTMYAFAGMSDKHQNGTGNCSNCHASVEPVMKIPISG